MTAPWCGVANSLRLESASEAARRARAAASNLRARSSPRSLPLAFSSHIQTGPLPVVPAASAVTRVQRRRPRQDEGRRGRVGCGRAALTDVEGISCYSRKLPLNSAVIPRSRFRWILLASIDASGKSRDPRVRVEGALLKVVIAQLKQSSTPLR